MEWGDFILSTLKPYSADWLIEGGWGEINYLVRIDGECNATLILGQNGGLQVDGEDASGVEGFDEGTAGEGLSDADESPDGDEDEDEESAGYGRNVRLPQVNRRLGTPVRWCK